VELYASGNVILTDHEYTILHLLRSHKFEDDARCAIREKYPFSHAANLTMDSIVTDPEEVKKLIADA
jgi:predicted ribosome quality control (RQC) complex YloA/Tae2 family protein